MWWEDPHGQCLEAWVWSSSQDSAPAKHHRDCGVAGPSIAEASLGTKTLDLSSLSLVHTGLGIIPSNTHTQPWAEPQLCSTVGLTGEGRGV